MFTLSCLKIKMVGRRGRHETISFNTEKSIADSTWLSFVGGFWPFFPECDVTIWI